VVSFEISVLLYNEGPGGMRDYLSAGEAMLPTVYMVRPPPPSVHSTAEHALESRTSGGASLALSVS
jgi:hypothetical protein